MSGDMRLSRIAGCAAALVLLVTSVVAAAGNDKRIEQVLAPLARAGEPGCVAGAAYDDGPVHAAAVGLADLAAGKRLDRRSVFNIASVSKQFTAFAILLLEQRGLLSLDDPVARHVLELDDSAAGVTLRHLLHHSGGLRDYAALLELQGRQQTDAVTREETLAILARQRVPNTPPGASYEYSNTGYFLLSVVVERVSGRSLAQFSADNIFGPLGMSSTRIVDRYPAGIARLARGYSPGEKGFDIRESVWEQTGDGQVHSTVDDLLRWSRNFATGRVGGPIVQRMLEPGVLASGERLSYAAGLVLDGFQGWPVLAHRGTVAGYRAYLLRVPAESFSVAVLCNRNDVQTNEYANAIARLYLKPLAAASSATQAVPADPRSPLLDASQAAAGWYRDPGTSQYLRVLQDGQQPRLKLGGQELSIRPVAGLRYRIPELGDARLAFVRAAAGVGTEIRIEAVPFHGRFVAVPEWPEAPLDSYAATYRSDEAVASIAVRIVDGQPVAQLSGESVVLQRAAPGELRSIDGQFVLRFAPMDAPRELLLFTHGLHGVRFARQRQDRLEAVE